MQAKKLEIGAAKAKTKTKEVALACMMEVKIITVHLSTVSPRKRPWFEKMQRNGVMECSVCHSKVVAGTPRSISRAYDKHKSKISSKQRVLTFLLVSGDCVLVGLQVFHFQYDS